MSRSADKKRANHKDVARLSGVSVATVSRVLNMPEKVSESTRSRVLAAIDELHFMPSAAAQAINSGRTRMVGALIPTFDNSIFTRFLGGLENRLAELGLSLVVAATEWDIEVEAKKAQELVGIGVEGLIVSGMTRSEGFQRLISRARLPTVAISCFDDKYHLPTVGYDNREATNIAMSYLCELGHRKIAIIHGPSHNNDRIQTRIKAVKEFQSRAELGLFEADIEARGGCRAVAQMLESRTNFSAILSFSDVQATGAIFELQRSGIDVPGEMSVIGMEDLPSSAFTFPTLTTVRLPVVQMGLQAANTLGNWVEHHDVPNSIRLPVELVVRNSTTRVCSGRGRMTP